MKDKWVDKGASPDILDVVTFGRASDWMGGHHLVENKETGEKKEVFVNPGQTVGEAISKGQFKKD